jgi:hypothetical protein
MNERFKTNPENEMESNDSDLPKKTDYEVSNFCANLKRQEKKRIS